MNPGIALLFWWNPRKFSSQYPAPVVSVSHTTGQDITQLAKETEVIVSITPNDPNIYYDAMHSTAFLVVRIFLAVLSAVCLLLAAQRLHAFLRHGRHMHLAISILCIEILSNIARLAYLSIDVSPWHSLYLSMCCVCMCVRVCFTVSVSLSLSVSPSLFLCFCFYLSFSFAFENTCNTTVHCNI